MRHARIAKALLAASLLLPSSALAVGSKPGNAKGWMTGGGNVVNKKGVKITHGFVLRCPKKKGASNLEVNWEGHRFHLDADTITYLKCTDSADWEEGKPEAGFDTIRVVGKGKLDGVEGASIYLKFGDAGEPGVDDFIQIDIKDANGVRAIAVKGTLDHGNHQAHGQGN